MYIVAVIGFEQASYVVMERRGLLVCAQFQAGILERDVSVVVSDGTSSEGQLFLSHYRTGPQLL